MPLNSNQIKFILGDAITVQGMTNISAFQPFDNHVIEYLDTVSKILLKDIEARQHADVITFAFWCRKSSIKNLQQPYTHMKNRIGRGVAFHIAPSNVAVNFAYSLVVGLLAGNANIVRLPTKEFDQVRIICKAFQNALDETIQKYLCLVQYGHNQEITDYLSAQCDSRIIWGGDQTITSIRKSQLKTRATELTFADRYSICVINGDQYLLEINKKSIAQGFYNDTYLSDQNACTSPRIIVWIGEKIAEAQELFWAELLTIVKTDYSLQPVQAVSKYSNLCKQAATNCDIHYISGNDNNIVRVLVSKLSDNLMECKGNSGYFMEYLAQSLDEILPICTTQCQTLSYYGIETSDLQRFVLESRPSGIDRIVPIGRTMDFSLIWDGYDLIRNLSREFIII